jgi:arylsulfate sulfotransferase
VWSWDAFDHLDPFRIGYQTIDAYWHTRGFPDSADWTHGNGVVYDAAGDAVVFSLKHQDAVLKVDRATGRIRWILGEPTDWGPLADRVLRPVGEPFRWPYHGHNPRLTRHGTIVMYDNGSWGARPFRAPVPPEQVQSRAVEFEVDERAMTVRQVWSSEDPRRPAGCHSPGMGDAHRLPVTDNMLVVYSICMLRRPGMTLSEYEKDKLAESQAPYEAFVREYTRSTPPQIVFEARIRDPNDVMQWEVYGGFRTPDL